jgi:hypothetical protein
MEPVCGRGSVLLTVHQLSSVDRKAHFFGLPSLLRVDRSKTIGDILPQVWYQAWSAYGPCCLRALTHAPRSAQFVIDGPLFLPASLVA